MSEEVKDAVFISLSLIFGITFIMLCGVAVRDALADRAARRCAEYGYGATCPAYKQVIKCGEAE